LEIERGNNLLVVSSECHLALDEFLVAIALALAQAAHSPGMGHVAELTRDAARATNGHRKKQAWLAETFCMLHGAD